MTCQNPGPTINDLAVDAARLGYQMALKDVVAWLQSGQPMLPWPKTMEVAKHISHLSDGYKERVTAESIRERP